MVKDRWDFWERVQRSGGSANAHTDVRAQLAQVSPHIHRLTFLFYARKFAEKSSAPVSRLYPTTSAASIAASFRVSAMTLVRNP